MSAGSLIAVTAFSIGIIVCLLSCGLKTYKLQNGRTKVPSDTTVFTKRTKFKKTLLEVVDTGVVYEEFNRRYLVLYRHDKHRESLVYKAIRFYADGRMNSFSINKDDPFSARQFNPRYNGRQGVYYLENGFFRIQFCAEVDQRGGAGLLYSTIRVSGDTLFEKRDDLDYEQIYIKRILPDSFLAYEAYW